MGADVAFNACSCLMPVCSVEIDNANAYIRSMRIYVSCEWHRIGDLFHARTSLVCRVNWFGLAGSEGLYTKSNIHVFPHRTCVET
ncbi:hypothetical protein [Methanohalophilus halophilus]|uniref:Uncharacterized protein n=1 Tax=Methanohalophilus halophilus TaxID=2177 RepID=A0A1L3PZG2_9EURY|nr:hypothetical protein [Methanohalophilus halophilus]APH38018.1 hypothetical protein BHR79_00005 [Methanohalophilus halophilus]RNI07315.1 hypothetical protein EFE40_10300 [Methanohalophilus halophilus]